MDPAMQAYFADIERQVDAAYELAETARSRGEDPSEAVEIPIARDMADRVQNLLGIPGVADRVRELEAEMSREEAALALAADFAAGDVGDATEPVEIIEGAVRTSVALLTEGVVAAPIEGIDAVDIETNDDGSEYVRVRYAGPIRSAGGTAQALSVLVADYARSLLGIGAYQPRDAEIERFVEEVALYDDDTGLQYSPSADETRFIARHCPICLDGEPTSETEVSGYRDLERIRTNRARGGMCLVLAEGIALKTRKIQRYTRRLDEVDWPWLDDLLEGDLDDSASEEPEAIEKDEHQDETVGGLPVPQPSDRYLTDLIAGRPVFSHPSRPGGFRLRYGRARNHGFATAGVSPASMHILDDFLATGTQIKTERPGKAAGVVPVDTLEGPTVKLRTGEVRRIDDPRDAAELKHGVERILDVGEYLVNAGEFVENNYPLAPAGYAVEWWELELDAAGVDLDALRDDPTIDLVDPEPQLALEWAERYDAPLHPRYTYLWHDVDAKDVSDLLAAVESGEVTDDVLVLERAGEIATTLETLLVPHMQEPTRVRIDTWRPICRSLGVVIEDGDVSPSADSVLIDDARDGLDAVNRLAPFSIRAKAPTRIGNRMGRPEKSEQRQMSPPVHTLFPLGEAGGDRRDIADATRHADSMQDTPGVITVDVGLRSCAACDRETFATICEVCDARTTPQWTCDACEITVPHEGDGRPTCPRCEQEVSSVSEQTIDIDAIYHAALERVGERESAFPILKGVKGLMSPEKTPEPVAKGVLRAKHGVSAFKDGTVRYDMTDLPVTAVRPDELSVPVEQFRELGYEEDIDGEPLEHGDQLVELFVQDIILSDGAAEHLLRTANFVDDLLERFYELEPFYAATDRSDLVGELVFGLAPHTSAAVVGRIVGFCDSSVGYAHPYFHAAKRRNCFHPETKLWHRSGVGDWEYSTIESFVEERLHDPDTDDFGTETQALDGDEATVSMTDDGEVVQRPITAVSKHPAPDHLINIETEHGRNMRVTADHRVHVFDLEIGEVVTRRAADLQMGDKLITPTQLDVIESSATEFDLLAEFLALDDIDNDRLMIQGLDRADLYELFTERLADEWEGEFYPLYSTAEYLKMNKKTLSTYLYHESFPASLLEEFFDTHAALLQFVPDDVALGIMRDSLSINRNIRLDKRVAALLGYYVAEGFTRAQETSKGTIYQTTFTGNDREMQEYYLDVLSNEFGVKPYVENESKVTASGRLLYLFFDRVLDAGKYAHTKRIPGCVLHAEKGVLGAFLGGYFSGDGSIHNGRITASTVSKELKEDLLAAFSRFGVAAHGAIDPATPLMNKFPRWYEDDPHSMSKPVYRIALSTKDAIRVSEHVSFHLSRKNNRLSKFVPAHPAAKDLTPNGGMLSGRIDQIKTVKPVQTLVDYVYCVTIKDTHSLFCNDLLSGNCDGDEDCVMLLMDGLLNFSKSYLPSSRGGRMDAPLVMSSRVDPSEIDDEAHNVDIVDRYPLSFYEATLEQTEPADLDLDLAGDTVGTDAEYRGFAHTHDTSNIALGPDLSAYKTLETMMDKVGAQLGLARKLRAVDETDVAERVIEYHFLPDLIGNLRAFSRQETRCLDCGTKYRRVPLTRSCRYCDGNVTLTVHEGSVRKYMETATEIAAQYNCTPYTVQRLDLLDRELESLFENDHNKQSGIADFM